MHSTAYRCVDKEGHTADFLLSEHRDSAAAERCLEQAVENHEVPQKITPDGYAASPEAVAELQEQGVLSRDLIVRTHRYVNTMIEQDQRRVKQRVRPMRGFKRFDHAAITISGIELGHQIKKD